MNDINILSNNNDTEINTDNSLINNIDTEVNNTEGGPDGIYTDMAKNEYHEKIINDTKKSIRAYLNGIQIKNNNNQILNSEVMFVFNTQIICKINDLISLYKFTNNVEQLEYCKQLKVNIQTTLSQLELQTTALLNKAISISSELDPIK